MDWSYHVFISDNSSTWMNRARANLSGGLLMIAKTRRMAMHDFLLIAFAVVVIVLSLAVKREKQQIVEIRDDSGNLQRYSLATDDPRLARLQGELAKWSKGRPNASLTLAKWHAELADFYVGRTAPKSPKLDNSAVVQASFADQASRTASNESAAMRAQNAYWTRVRDQARQAIVVAEEKLSQRSSSSAKPPIALAEVTNSGLSMSDFGRAGVSGFGVAIAFACWIYVCPAISLGEDRRSRQWATECSNEGQPKELRLSIPPQWVRIRQPVAVVTRRVVYATLVLAALARTAWLA